MKGLSVGSKLAIWVTGAKLSPYKNNRRITKARNNVQITRNFFIMAIPDFRRKSGIKICVKPCVSKVIRHVT